MFYRIGLVALALGLAGCATPPKATSFQNAKTVRAPYDATWEQLVEFFATRNISLKNIAKDSGVIYAESMSFDASFADCGKNFLMVPQQNIMSVNVFVHREGDMNRVSVNTNFRQVLTGPYNSVQTVNCYSKGVVEEMVLNAIHDAPPAG